MAEPARRSNRHRNLAGLSSLIGVLVAVAGLAFVARSLFSDWDETQSLLRTASWGWLVVATLVGLTAMGTVGVLWRWVMAALGQVPTVSETLRWYFPGQLGKYVPGGIWPVVGRGELAVRGGADRSLAYVSVTLSLALTYLAAALLASILLVVTLLVGSEAGGGIWALLVLPLGLAILHPKVLRALVVTAERLLSRQVPIRVPPYRTTVAILFAHLPAWVLVGLSTWLVARAFVPDPDLAPVMFAAVLSWLVGFVVVPVPGGLGVREAAFVAAASASLGADVAATVAIAVRLCFVVADVGGAAGALALSKGRRGLSGTLKASPSEPPDARP